MPRGACITHREHSIVAVHTNMQSRTRASESATHKLSALKAPALCFSLGSVNREQLLPERSFIRLCATIYTHMKCVTAKVVGIPLLSPINTYTQGIIVSSTSTTGSVWFWSLVVSLLCRPPPLPQEQKRDRKATPRAPRLPWDEKVYF